MKRGYGDHDSCRDTETKSFESEVRVHDGMDSVVGCDVEPVSGQRTEVGEADTEENSCVMVPVEEDEFLFPQHDEESVAEFDEFGSHVEESPETIDAVRVGILADGVMDPFILEGEIQLRNTSHHAPC